MGNFRHDGAHSFRTDRQTGRWWTPSCVDRCGCNESRQGERAVTQTTTCSSSAPISSTIHSTSATSAYGKHLKRAHHRSTDTREYSTRRQTTSPESANPERSIRRRGCNSRFRRSQHLPTTSCNRTAAAARPTFARRPPTAISIHQHFAQRRRSRSAKSIRSPGSAHEYESTRRQPREHRNTHDCATISLHAGNATQSLDVLFRLGLRTIERQQHATQPTEFPDASRRQWFRLARGGSQEGRRGRSGSCRRKESEGVKISE